MSIIFDIETGPGAPEVIEANMPAFEAPGSYKNPEAIAKYVGEKQAEFRGRAALDPIIGKVLAIGIRDNGETEIDMRADEAGLLRAFWARIAPTGAIVENIIGFNSNRFDIPYLVRRSWLHRVQVPRTVMSGRYLNNRFIDLMQIWQVGDYQATVSLDRLAKYLGVGAKNGSGACFHEILETDREAARAYLENDLLITEQCAIALGVLEQDTRAAAALAVDVNKFDY